jgi:hypothetical protein
MKTEKKRITKNHRGMRVLLLDRDSELRRLQLAARLEPRNANDQIAYPGGGLHVGLRRSL